MRQCIRQIQVLKASVKINAWYPVKCQQQFLLTKATEERHQFYAPLAKFHTQIHTHTHTCKCSHGAFLSTEFLLIKWQLCAYHVLHDCRGRQKFRSITLNDTDQRTQKIFLPVYLTAYFQPAAFYFLVASREV